MLCKDFEKRSISLNAALFSIYISTLHIVLYYKHATRRNVSNNILGLYKVLAQLWFATSKTELDILCKKFCIRVASQAEKRLKTSSLRYLGTIRKILNFDEDITCSPVSLLQRKE